MPKRVGYIYQRMNDPDFIRRCIRIGSKESKKRRRRDVQRVLRDIDGHVKMMQEIVEQRSFQPVNPHHRTRYDPSSQKYRETYSVPFFPDGLMHIMEVQAMMDVLMRGMSHWSCSSVPGRGGKRIQKRIKSALRNDPKGTKYACEMDVKSYYPSIPVDRLMAAYARKIKDEEFLLLVAMTLTSCQMTLADAKAAGLTWREVTAGKRGICIGFYLCQWSANFYLEPVDHLTEEQPGVKYMVRNMDNLTILGGNKKKLHAARRAIEACMRERLGLQMKGNWQVYPTKKRMVCAVGYRYAATHTILRKRNFLRLCRQCRRIKKRIAAGKAISYRQAAGLLSRIGQLKHCNSMTIRKKYVDPVGIRHLKEVVSYESKRRQSAQRRLQRGADPQEARLRPRPAV